VLRMMLRAGGGEEWPIGNIEIFPFGPPAACDRVRVRHCASPRLSPVPNLILPGGFIGRGFSVERPANHRTPLLDYPGMIFHIKDG
jgi:hypothetical protein